jgi:colanic acid/amylovoran biosynthesis protein
MNLGDVAMLQVMVNQLRTLWPDASLEVITNVPEKLAIQCPGTKPVSYMGRYSWVGEDYLLGKLHRRLPESLSREPAKLKRTLGRYSPALVKSVIRLKAQLRHIEGDPGTFLEALEGADLVIVSGMGGLTDNARFHARLVLDTLDMAIRRGKPTAMMGQGVGPIEDPDLLAHVKAVAPQVGFIGLREGVGGLPLLESLGVRRERMAVTGDDAIPLAYDLRTTDHGSGVGINLRVARHAGTDAEVIEKVRRPLQAFASRHHAPLVPLPIALHDGAKDPQTIRSLMVGYDDKSDGGQSITTPREVIENAGQCRIVVTGAYHAAIFAISQGIPVVALTQSQYYTDKYVGLADQFGTGCETVYLNSPNFSNELTAAMQRAWDTADEVRQPLLDAARHQIMLIEQAYQCLPGLLNEPIIRKSALSH